SSRSNNSKSTPVALRENRLKLTPPSTTVAPRGELWLVCCMSQAPLVMEKTAACQGGASREKPRPCTAAPRVAPARCGRAGDAPPTPPDAADAAYGDLPPARGCGLRTPGCGQAQACLALLFTPDAVSESLTSFQGLEDRRCAHNCPVNWMG